MIAFKLLIVLLVQIATSIDVKNCNSPLLTKESAGTFVIQTPTNQDLAQLGTNDYLHLTGEAQRTMQIQFNTQFYITGIGINTNTVSRSPCSLVESSIYLSEFEIMIDNKRVDLANRNTVSDSFVKVSTRPIFGSNVQIHKFTNESTPMVYCIQYQLYGCAEAPTGCRSLLSYDTPKPVGNDTSYTGVCKAGKCSGGLGALSDGDFESKLRWNSNTYFRLSFYQQVGIDEIGIYTKSNLSIRTDFQSVQNDKYISIQIGKTINFLEFHIVAQGQSFELQEIKITSYSRDTLICVEEDMTTIWLTIGIGVLMFLVGFALPIAIWYTQRKIVIWRRGKKVVGAGGIERAQTEHVYTDIQSKASTAQVNNLERVNIANHATVATASLPNYPRGCQLKFTESIEDKVRQLIIEKENEPKSLINSCLEDNPLYSTSNLDNIERNASEIFTRDNPQYVTKEMLNSANKKKVTYENTIVPENDSLFNAYDKLDRNTSS